MSAPTSPVIEQSPACSNANQPIPLRQRLIICLDGTWNKRDSGTHIYHLSNLIETGELTTNGAKWCQLVHYDAGVGTGLLDSVSGGAFGLGLSENVREAYDFLVEHYQDGDEIYIFGFSRGAFTARSLVGLIAKCGLLRRGAPIPPEELWEAYRILGRHRHERSDSEPAANWWEHIVGKPPKPFREIEELRREPWEKDLNLNALKAPWNRAEHLLIKWSRRVPITCVGVFDTVGSMGWDALAIPWLRSQTAQFHDTRFSAIVRNGFQALAIDEHRANFIHIPWHQSASSRLQTGATDLGGRIEQRWFMGAHSNIGGGYDDNVLSEYPLAWMLSEAEALGLVLRARPALARSAHAGTCCPLLDPEGSTNALAKKPAPLRDSYSEFSGGIWRHIIRAKREYRRIAPPPELQNGQPVQSANEVVDPSVRKLIKANKAGSRSSKYYAPNLWEYWKRKRGLVPEKMEEPVHRYLEGWRSFAMLALWLGLIALAGWNIGKFIAPEKELVGKWLAIVLPLLAWFADWRESVLNHSVALAPDGFRAERHMAWMDVCLIARLGAFFTFLFGAGCAVWLAGSLFTLEIPSAKLLGDLIALGALGLLAVWFHTSMTWCSAPMSEAGMGSIVVLQQQRTPEGVKECLLKWSGLDHTHAKPAEMQHLLLPVVRAIWRDMLGFIPAYSLFIFAGTWLGASLLAPLVMNVSGATFWRDLLAVTWWGLGTAACITLASMISDYVEDIVHLKYLKQFPVDPTKAAVRIANVATLAKSVAFITGLLITSAAAVSLICRVFAHMEEVGARQNVFGMVVIRLEIITLTVSAFTIVAYAGIAFALLGSRKRRLHGRKSP